MNFFMLNPKDCSWDKIEDIVLGGGIGCMMRDREKKLDIRGWICRSAGLLKCITFQVLLCI